MCAMRGRKSVATTMGFTALDGLPMGRRCGALDPGVVLYLIQEKGMTGAQVSDLLYQQSGSSAFPGSATTCGPCWPATPPPSRRWMLFVYRIGRELGSLAAALAGLDALVFTAGIGERAVEIRRRVCEQASWLGFEIDQAANNRGAYKITKEGGKASAWVIPTDEDLMIACHSWALLGAPRDC